MLLHNYIKPARANTDGRKERRITVKITIEATENEIAALIVALQEQPESKELLLTVDGVEVNKPNFEQNISFPQASYSHQLFLQLRKCPFCREYESEKRLDHLRS